MSFFRNYKTIIFIVVLLSLALIILSYNLKHESQTGLIRKVVLEMAAPVQNVLSASIITVSDSWSRYIFLVGIEEENKKLKQKINEQKSQLVLFQEGYLEAQRLRTLLALNDSFNFNFVAARVIGREQGTLSKTILINKGAAHGLNAGIPVMAGPGLIGRIIDVSWHTAKVLLLIDESSNIDAIVQRSRTQGIIRGAGSPGCILKYISKTQDVKEGDTVVSSGIGGIFPKGLMIGQVSHVDRQDAGLFLKINVAPAIDFSKVEEVLVVLTSDDDKTDGG
jgi:rod shape-determining protein MreC